MIKNLTLLLITVVSLLLGFFCVENHKKSILAKLIPQQTKEEISVEKIETKIIQPTSEPTPETSSIQMIESVERIEPVVTIKVDETEPNKPIIRKMSTEDLLRKEENVKSNTTIKPPPISILTDSTTKEVLSNQQETAELEKKMLEEINDNNIVATPTPTNTPKVINKATVTDNKIEVNIDRNEMSELERQMLEEMKNFK
ncbi:MAG: hypothetical protein KAG56_02145 [Sulfurovaceae bacterium]|nr:hypothetical protein [Sulfurovaceae bacterium]